MLIKPWPVLFLWLYSSVVLKSCFASCFCFLQARLDSNLGVRKTWIWSFFVSSDKEEIDEPFEEMLLLEDCFESGLGFGGILSGLFAIGGGCTELAGWLCLTGGRSRLMRGTDTGRTSALNLWSRSRNSVPKYGPGMVEKLPSIRKSVIPPQTRGSRARRLFRMSRHSSSSWKMKCQDYISSNVRHHLLS